MDHENPTTLEPGKLPELPPQDPLPRRPYTNDNLYFNRLGAAQGITFGDWNTWYLGGYAPASGSSGQAACDGWTHEHKSNWPKRRESVIANLCDTRRFFYTNAPHRQYGYEHGGRPDGWTPEIVGNPDPALRYDDHPAGYVLRPRADGVLLKVDGPEPEHVWITHLIPLADDPTPVMLNAPYGHKLSSKDIGRVLINYVMRSIAGQIRNPNDPVLPVNWGFGDRANSRLVDSYFDAAIRGPSCIELLDATTLDIWLRHVMIPFYKGGAGIGDFRKSGDPHGEFTIGWFNGLGWILPVCYRAAVMSRAAGADWLADELTTLVERWSNWVLEMFRRWPEMNMSRIRVNREVMMRGPHFSLEQAGLLDTATAEFGGGWWEGYTFYALAVTARVTGDPALQAAFDARKADFATTKTRPEERVWLVDADRKPIW